MNFGIITGESNAEYHSQDCVSASKLRTFARRPGGAQLYYRSYIAKTIPREETEAMAFGTALHMAVLEPEKFAQSYVASPKFDRRTTVGKADSAAFALRNQGKAIVDEPTMSEVLTLASSVSAHPLARELLGAGQAETSWRVKAQGLRNLPPLQCRTDWYNGSGCALSEGRPYIVDVKTTSTLEESAFGNFHRHFEDLAYHEQAGLYMAICDALGSPVRDFFFIAVERSAPNGVMVFRLGDRALEEGQATTAERLIELNECYRRNEWPNTPLDLQELKLSPRYWAKKDAA